MVILILLWQSLVQRQFGFSYIDELAVLALALYFVLLRLNNRKLSLTHNEKKGAVCIICFYLSGLMSTAIYNYQNSILYGMASGLFSMKAFAAYFFAREYYSRRRLTRKRARLLLVSVEYPIVITSVLLLVDQLFPIFPHGGVRFGISYSYFLFVHPTELACFGISSMLMAVYLREELGYKGKYYRNILPSLIVVIISGRFKAVGFIVMYICLRFMLPIMKQFRFRYVVIALPLLVAIARDQILFYFTDMMATARGALYFKSIEVAKDHFPIGAGFATYGTEFSRERYSPLYYKYGLSNIYGLHPSAPLFVTDTGWPPIIGETGILGTLLVIMCIVFLEKNILEIKGNKVLSQTIQLLFIYLLIESAADSIFMSARGVTIMVILGFMISTHISGGMKKE